MSWKTLVQTIAPVLGTALGGPLGGMAVKAIGGALLGDDETAKLEGKALEKRIEAAIDADPGALLKLKQANQTFEIQLREQDLDLEKINQEFHRIDAADRTSARTLAERTSLLPQAIIATVFIIGFVVVLWSVFSGSFNMTQDQKDIAMYLLGILSAGLVQILNFFFGSSSGSKEKTKSLARHSGALES